MIMFKDVDVDPVPNYKRDVKKGTASWDAYAHVPDPDALAAEFSWRNVEFSEPLKDTDGERAPLLVTVPFMSMSSPLSP